MTTATTPAFPVAVGTPIPAAEHATLVARMKAIVGNEQCAHRRRSHRVRVRRLHHCQTEAECRCVLTSTEHIVGIMKTCNELGLNFIARGAGTSLAGGCVLGRQVSARYAIPALVIGPTTSCLSA